MIRTLAASAVVVGILAGLLSASIERAAAANGQFADSSDFVHIVKIEHRDGNKIIITLRVDEGFHINANPASEPYLIPTTVRVAGIAPDYVSYPPAVRFKPKFAEEPLDVYEGTVTIVTVFPRAKLDGIRSPQLTVSVQACTDRICFPPADLSGSP